MREEAKMNREIGEISVSVKHILQRLDVLMEHDKRISSLEKSKWIAHGFLLSISGIISFAINVVVRHF